EDCRSAAPSCHRSARFSPASVGRDLDDRTEWRAVERALTEDEAADATLGEGGDDPGGTLASEARVGAREHREPRSLEEDASEGEKPLLLQREDAVPIVLDVEPAHALDGTVDRDGAEGRPDPIVRDGPASAPDEQLSQRALGQVRSIGKQEDLLQRW